MLCGGEQFATKPTLMRHFHCLSVDDTGLPQDPLVSFKGMLLLFDLCSMGIYDPLVLLHFFLKALGLFVLTLVLAVNLLTHIIHVVLLKYEVLCGQLTQLEQLDQIFVPQYFQIFF